MITYQSSASLKSLGVEASYISALLPYVTLLPTATTRVSEVRGQGALPCADALSSPGRRGGPAGSEEGTRNTRWCVGAEDREDRVTEPMSTAEITSFVIG